MHDNDLEEARELAERLPTEDAKLVLRLVIEIQRLAELVPENYRGQLSR